MNTQQDQQDQQEQDQLQFLKEWRAREYAIAKFAADAAKARAWRVLRRRQTAAFDLGAPLCTAK